MPTECEGLHGLDPFYQNRERSAGMGLLKCGDAWVDGGRGDSAGHLGALDKGAIEGDTEPTAELLRVNDGPPDTFVRSAQNDSLLDAVCIHKQPPGCLL